MRKYILICAETNRTMATTRAKNRKQAIRNFKIDERNTHLYEVYAESRLPKREVLNP